MPGGRQDRPRAIFEAHGYRAPGTDHDWAAVTRLGREVAGLLTLIADGDHPTTIDLLNEQLRTRQVIPMIEERSGARVLHFHGPDAAFADGWAAGIGAATAMAYSTGDAERIGRCMAPGCGALFLDLGRNRQRRFCGLRCQNRAKSVAYRRRLAR